MVGGCLRRVPHGVYLMGVYLTGVHLMGAYLMVVDLSRSELQNTSFYANCEVVLITRRNHCGELSESI